MAVELPISHASALAPLLDAVPQDQSFIRGTMRDPAARLLVDDPADPSVVMLWPARSHMKYFGGCAEPREGALADVVRLMLSLGGGKGPWLRLAMPFLGWTDMLMAAFGNGFAPRGRRSYTLTGAPGQLEPLVSDGYKLQQIDESLARDVAERADPELTEHWPDLRAFAQRSIGFCAVELGTGRVASAAWSVFPPVDLVEIAVGTATDHRGRGLAPAAAHALVRWCLARGLDPRWSTDFDNLASRRVAAKLGFGNVVEHDWPLYTPFNAQRRAIDLPEEATRAYHGRYTADGKTIRIDHDGYALRFYDQLGQTLTLAAETETRFFLREVDIQLEFTRSAIGEVDGFTRVQGGKAWRMARVTE
jgi:GNAT superfamily N-acetyltransferase